MSEVKCERCGGFLWFNDRGEVMNCIDLYAYCPKCGEEYRVRVSVDMIEVREDE